MTRVIVIDDDTDILVLVKFILDTHGMQATISSEPLAIDILIKETQPQLILMDINMPPYDGRNICLRIKQSKPKLPILLFSANKITDESIQKCGADGFLAKPFDIDELVKQINTLVA